MALDASVLPDVCGVYIFRSGTGKVLYVGKAIDIRARVRSHLQARSDHKEARLCSETASIDYIATSSEMEALVLEDTLIKRHLPRFNVRLKDDKSYPYLVITDEEYPSIQQVRGLKPGLGAHFGPHGDPVAVRRSLRWLRKYFPVRSCRRDMSRPSRPCLEFHLRRCMAPCSGKVDRGSYMKAVEGLKRFLSGRREDLMPELEREMWTASSEQAFERAALLRDLLEGLNRMREAQRVILIEGGEMDLVHVAGDMTAATVLKVRDGRVVDLISFSLEAEVPFGNGAEEVVTRYYALSMQVPARILVDPYMDDEKVRSEMERFLSAKAGSRTVIGKARGKDQRTLMEMARKNTMLFLARNERESGGGAVLERLKELLDLSKVPRTIEGFDVSHLAGTGTVASMVRFEEGRPVRTGYRRFRMRDDRNDDALSMAEAVERRLRRLLDRNDPAPDLLLIDGGKGQLSSVMGALERLGLVEVPDVVALAKREEELFLPGRATPVRLRRGDPGLMLLQRVRDESHRFAVSYQRKLRKVDLGLLMEVPGIGEARARRIMTEYGSLDEVLAGGIDGLTGRCSLSSKVAASVIETVAKGRPTSPK